MKLIQIEYPAHMCIEIEKLVEEHTGTDRRPVRQAQAQRTSIKPIKGSNRRTWSDCLFLYCGYP